MFVRTVEYSSESFSSSPSSFSVFFLCFADINPVPLYCHTTSVTICTYVSTIRLSIPGSEEEGTFQWNLLDSSTVRIQKDCLVTAIVSDAAQYSAVQM